MTESATPRPSSRAKKTNPGDDLSVFQRNGFATEIPTALMALTRTQHFTTAQHRNLVPTINSLARMDGALTKDGLAIMTTIVATGRMKESSAMRSTRRVRLRSSLVRTSSASEINTDAVSFAILLKVSQFLMYD